MDSFAVPKKAVVFSLRRIAETLNPQLTSLSDGSA